MHISKYFCRTALWTSKQSDTQVFASNLDDLRLNTHTRNFATFRIVSWELLFMRVMRCVLGSCTLIMLGRYLLLNCLYTGHWNIKYISVSGLLAQNGHAVFSVVVENRYLWRYSHSKLCEWISVYLHPKNIHIPFPSKAFFCSYCTLTTFHLCLDVYTICGRMNHVVYLPTPW